MALGPEFILGLEEALSKKLPWRVTRVEGGETWVALKVSFGEAWLILSWTSGAVGCCMAGNGDVSALLGGASGRSTLVEALKSRVIRGDIVSAGQLNHDRVLVFEVCRRVAAGTSVNYFLVLEATEPIGNLVMLDGNRKIEEAAHHSAPDQNRYRTLLPGHPYTPPPEFQGLLADELKQLNFEDVQRIKGVGRPLTRLIQSHWEERDPGEWLSALQDAGRSHQKCQMTPKGYLTCFGIPFSETIQLGDDPLKAAERGVLVPLLSRGRERQLREADAILKRAVRSKERHRDGLLKKLRDCEAAEVFRRKGEVILANIDNIPKRADTVTLADWEGREFRIALDPRLSPSKNAERYFRKYRKAKSDPEAIRAEAASLEVAIRELMEQYDVLEAIRSSDDFEISVRDLKEWLSPDEGSSRGGSSKKPRRRAAPVPPHLSVDADGATILVGLSARGNRYVTFRQARPEDIWLHAHELPGSHVIIRGLGRAELEGERRDVLELAASLAASHSKGGSANSVSVDYTERRYVRPVPGTVSLVTYTNPGTLRVSPAENSSTMASTSSP